MKWIKRISLCILVILLLIGTSLQLAPWFAVNWLQDYYASQGDDHKLTIHDWSLNLLDGKFSVTDISAQWNHDKEAKIEKLSLDIRWLPLFSKTLLVDSIHLEGFNVPIRQETNNWNIAGVAIPIDGSSEVPENSSEKTTDDNLESNNKEDSGWILELKSIAIANHAYDIDSEALSTQLTIHNFQVNNLSSNQVTDIPLTLSASLSNLSSGAIQQAEQDLSINLDGDVSNIMSTPKFMGKLGVENIAFTNPMISLGMITLEGLAIEQSKLSTDKFLLSDVMLGKQQDDAFWLSLDKYWLNTLTVTQSGLASGIHYVSGLKVNSYRNANGKMMVELFENRQATSKQEPTKTKTQTEDISSNDAKTSTSDFFINIEGITLQDSSDDYSTIWFRDESIQPKYVVPMALKDLSISALSMKDLASPLEPDINIQLQASVDDYSEMNFNATLNRENGWPVGKATIELEQFNIIPLNGYMIKAIGYRAQKGMLNVTTDLVLNDEQLSGETKIFLRNSKLEPQDEDTISRVSKQISMPVDTALDLLRDDNGNLQLSIPMSGKVSDPDFAYDDVMNQLGTLALKTASMHYLQQSLQPYGAFISLLSFATDSLMAIRLNQLDFQPDKTELTKQHQAYLDKVVKIMGEKTELELQVCPFVSKQEAEQDSWPKLGQARAEAVKAYLAQYQDEDKQDLAKRTTLCVTEIADTPHVDLGV